MQPLQNNELLLHCLNRDYSKLSLFAHNNKNDKSVKEVFSEALCFCAYYEIIDVMDKLIDYGASVEYKDCNLCSPIHWAALGGKMGSIKYLFSKGATPLPRNKMWQTPIHILAAVGDYQSIEFISQLSNNLRSADRRGWTVIHYACYYGSLQTLEFLAKLDFSLEENDKRGFKPLHLATTRGNLEIVQELLEYGVNPDAKTSKGLTALHLSILYKHERIFEILAAKGASFYETTDDGNTAFHFVFLSASEHLVQRVFSHDITCVLPNIHKQTPFHTMCLTTNLQDQRMKLLEKANFLEKDENGWNILHYLAYSGDHHSIFHTINEMLLVYSADNHGWRPLHYAILKGQKEAIKQILEMFPEELNCTTNFGESALHLAVATCDPETISYLISKKCSLNAVDKYGRGAVHLAGFLCDDVGVLEKIHTEENMRMIDSFGLSPIFYALASKKLKNVMFFLDKCPDLISSTDLKGRSLLHYASYNGLGEILKFLLENHCPNVPDQSGFTSLHYAVYRGNMEAIMELTREIKDPSVLLDQKLLILLANHEKCSDIIDEFLDLSSEEDMIKYACTDLSPLFYASRITIAETLEKYLKFFSLSSDYFKRGVSNPLHYAASTGNDEFAEMLLTLFPEIIDYQNEEMSTPLMIAATNSHLSMIQNLIKAGCNLNIQGAYGYTALHYAVVYHKVEAAQKLVDEAAKVNIEDDHHRTPLLLGCILGLSDIIPFMLEAQADPEHVDSSGFTALHWAALKSAEECIDILIMDVGSQLIFLGNSFSPLHCAVISEDEESSVHIFTKLIQASVGSLEDEDEVNMDEDDEKLADDNIQKIQQLVDDDGRNPLHYAILAQNVSIVECICQNQIFCPNLKDSYGYNSIMLASISGCSTEILDMLFELNPDLSERDNDGNTALMLAIEHKHPDTAIYLIDKMTLEEINMCNGKNSVPLHSALKHKYLDVVEALIKREADPLIKDKLGRSSISQVALLDLPKKTIVKMIEMMIEIIPRSVVVSEPVSPTFN